MPIPMYSVITAAGGLPAFKDMSGPWRAFMGIPGGGANWRTRADYARAPADEAWVYACVRRRYAAAMSVPLVVYVRDGPQRIPAADSSDGAAQRVGRPAAGAVLAPGARRDPGARVWPGPRHRLPPSAARWLGGRDLPC